MRNILVVVTVLWGALILLGNKSTAVPNAGFTSPIFVSRLGLQGQTQPIPTTTLFTVPQSGLYRLSTYMATTQTDPSGNGWILQFDYTDDAGLETMFPLTVYSNKKPPSAFALSYAFDDPVGITFRAVAGTPVHYAVNTTQGQGGTYELFIVVERLM